MEGSIQPERQTFDFIDFIVLEMGPHFYKQNNGNYLFLKIKYFQPVEMGCGLSRNGEAVFIGTKAGKHCPPKI